MISPVMPPHQKSPGTNFCQVVGPPQSCIPARLEDDLAERVARSADRLGDERVQWVRAVQAGGVIALAGRVLTQ